MNREERRLKKLKKRQQHLHQQKSKGHGLQSRRAAHQVGRFTLGIIIFVIVSTVILLNILK